jgi:hypothetical protein
MARERDSSGPAGTDAGIGGGLRYIREVASSRMVNQEHTFSCVIACARQLLRDAGEDASEAELIESIGVREGFGSELESAAAVLSERHPRLTYVAGSIDPDAVAELVRRDPWIARVKTLSGRYHTVIVDGLREDILTVRDPWGLSGPGSGSGTVATILLDHFREHWRFGIHEAIVPIGHKAGGRR